MALKGLLEDLVPIVGESGVTVSEFERILYSHDLAPLPRIILFLFKTLPDAVVQPQSAEEVAELVKYARKTGISVTPRGAATFGLGGAVATKGGIMIDLTKMNKIEIDKEHGTVTVGAGLYWGKLAEELEKEGFVLRTYTSSAPAATVGGWISTGGLGVGTLKYGHVREQIVEMEVVTPTGEVVRVSKQKPNELGYEMDWFVGSEGTLGIITEVTLRISPKPEVLSPHVVCFKDVEGMCATIVKLIESSAKPYYIEFADEALLNMKRQLGLFAPEEKACAMFIFEGSKETVEYEREALHNLVADTGGEELDEERAHEEWADRFYSVRIKRAGPTLLAGEILVPITKLGDAINRLWELKERYDFKMGVHGSIVSPEHALLMPMILADERKSLRFLLTMPAIRDVSKLGLAVGGKPYGVGIWNSFYLKKVYGDSETRKMRERKKSLDPDNIMNPGKFYQVKTRFGIPFTSSLYELAMIPMKILKAFV